MIVFCYVQNNWAFLFVIFCVEQFQLFQAFWILWIFSKCAELQAKHRRNLVLWESTRKHHSAGVCLGCRLHHLLRKHLRHLSAVLYCFRKSTSHHGHQIPLLWVYYTSNMSMTRPISSSYSTPSSKDQSITQNIKLKHFTEKSKKNAICNLVLLLVIFQIETRYSTSKQSDCVLPSRTD